jgi:hypothetical protein
LTTNHPDYKGSIYNVLVQWEDGSQSYKPLQLMITDEPMTLATYAKEHDLLTTPGWKRLKPIAADLDRNKLRLRIMVHQYNVSKGKHSKGPIYKFGIQVPRNVKEAYALDKNGNTKWTDAMNEEISSLLEFSTFKTFEKSHIWMDTKISLLILSLM